MEVNIKKVRKDESLVSLRFTGEGFLKQQIRNMVGTLIELGQNKRDLDSIRRLLKNPEKEGGRQAAGYCVPPEGLYLLRVRYK